MRATSYITLVILAAAFVCFCLVGCHTKEKKEAGYHILDWNDYTGVELPGAAVYLFDGQIVGKGNEGYTSVKNILAGLPKGSVVVVAKNYYEMMEKTPSGPRLLYPFDEEDLMDYASQHGITLRFVGQSLQELEK